MPVITAKMSEQEKKVVENILHEERQGGHPPWKTRGEMVSFIDSLLHKAFSEGMIHNS